MAFARSFLINIFKRYLTRTSFCKRGIDPDCMFLYNVFVVHTYNSKIELYF